MLYVHKNSKIDNELAVSRGFLIKFLRTASIFYVVRAAFLIKLKNLTITFAVSLGFVVALSLNPLYFGIFFSLSLFHHTSLSHATTQYIMRVHNNGAWSTICFVSLDYGLCTLNERDEKSNM